MMCFMRIDRNLLKPGESGFHSNKPFYLRANKEKGERLKSDRPCGVFFPNTAIK